MLFAIVSKVPPTSGWPGATYRGGAEVLILKGHTGGITSAVFSPDGSRIASDSADGTANVWDTTPVNRELLAKEPAPPPGAAK
jgi:WD40 repeat protein